MSTDQALRKRITELEQEQLRLQRFEQISHTLIQVANAVNSTKELQELYGSIHRSLSAIVDTSNFFISLYTPENDGLTFPYCVDEVDDHYPPVIDVSKTSSLTAEVIRTGKPLLVSKKEMLTRRARSLYMSPACSISEIWLGVPLKVREDIIGVMAVQSYTDPKRYSQADMDVLVSVADQVATAIERKRAKEALWESEDRYSAVVKQASEGIYLLDPVSKKIIEANTSFFKMIGRNQEDIGNLYVYDFVAHEKNEVDRIIEQIISRQNRSAKSYFIGERTYKKRDGRLLDVEASATLMTYGGKAVLCVIIRDITDRKKSETALRESERKYRRLIENTTDAIYLADSDGKIVNVNQAACKVLGYTRAELLQLSVEDLDSNSTNEQFKTSYEQIPDETSNLFESSHIRKDGTIIPVEINSLAYHDHGQRYVIGVVRDITERKHNEEALQASAIRTRAFFSAINDAIFVHPLQEKSFAPFIEVNDIACKRYGYTRDEFFKLNVMDITKKVDATQHGTPDHRKKLLEKGQLVFETIHIRKNGEEFPVEINSNIMEQYGKPVILAVVRDITERKQAQAEREQLESQLQQSQKMESIGRLAGGIAHDFNNMLSVILGYTEMALGETSTSHPLHDDLMNIRLAAEHSAELTRQLLAFAKKQTVTPRILDINKTIGSMLEMLGRLIGEDITLTWLPANNLWPAQIDPSQLNQILANMCVNARDAITGPGKITIATENVSIPESDQTSQPEQIFGEFIRIKVVDDGHGIPQEYSQQIFEPFFTTKNVGQGTGLGLATVYGIIKQNKGFIEFESEPGSGTIFLIRLPRYHGKSEQIFSKKGAPVVQSGRETILVVEDEPAILTMTKIMLEKYGYHVLAAGTPGEATKIAEENKDLITLLLTDVIMPEMNGRDLAEHLISLNPDLKCLFMSGYPADVIAHQGIVEEGVHFIQKPFHGNALAGRISDILRSNTDELH